MKYDPEIHHRRSVRLRGYDYARAAAYFVTVCVHEKEHLFGEVVEGEIVLNEAGRMVEAWWRAIPRRYATVQVDSFVVMPNHIHGIIRIVGADPRVRPSKGAHVGADKQGAHIGAPLHRVVQWFKTMTTNDYLRCVHKLGWPPLSGKLWQRNYYEHISRNQRELNVIREYIATNPVRWDMDPKNPTAKTFPPEAPWL